MRVFEIRFKTSQRKRNLLLIMKDIQAQRLEEGFYYAYICKSETPWLVEKKGWFMMAHNKLEQQR